MDGRAYGYDEMPNSVLWFWTNRNSCPDPRGSVAEDFDNQIRAHDRFVATIDSPGIPLGTVTPPPIRSRPPTRAPPVPKNVIPSPPVVVRFAAKAVLDRTRVPHPPARACRGLSGSSSRPDATSAGIDANCPCIAACSVRTRGLLERTT